MKNGLGRGCTGLIKKETLVQFKQEPQRESLEAVNFLQGGGLIRSVR